MYDNTVVFLTADHEEGFHDHGCEVDHGGSFQHTVRVLLVVKLPQAKRTGRLAISVKHVDVVPTVIDLAGIPVDDLPDEAS